MAAAGATLEGSDVVFPTRIMNEHLICSLCIAQDKDSAHFAVVCSADGESLRLKPVCLAGMGYLRDACTVTECLHTCKSPPMQIVYRSAGLACDGNVWWMPPKDNCKLMSGTGALWGQFASLASTSTSATTSHVQPASFNWVQLPLNKSEKRTKRAMTSVWRWQTRSDRAMQNIVDKVFPHFSKEESAAEKHLKREADAGSKKRAAQAAAESG
eukprot:1119460-Rhodomonas_salina.2